MLFPELAMPIRWWMLVGAVFACPAAWLPATFAADEGAEERAELRNAQREIRSTDVEKRVEGIRRLRDIPGVEAAKVLVSAGLIDSAPAVRRVAYRTLLAWKDDQAIAAFLLRTLSKESRAKKKGASCTMPLAAILLASKRPDIQRDLGKFLDAYAASQAARPR